MHTRDGIEVSHPAMTHAEMFATSPIKIGGVYRFDYPEEFSSLPDYSARRGMEVTVVAPAPENEADVIWDDPEGTGEDRIVDRMFIVKAADGWTGHAWESELRAKIFALLSSQGTACSETVLFAHEYTAENRARIEADIDPSNHDAPIPGTWVDCTDNDALQGWES